MVLNVHRNHKVGNNAIQPGCFNLLHVDGFDRHYLMAL